MATVNYPELLPHPLVSDGYGFRSNQSQAVGLFDVETQSRDETRTVNVGFTFTDLQYKVFHGWFMNVLVHGQKWFNMRLDGEFYECTFGGLQPRYSLNRKIITVTATLKTRPNTGFVNYTNQRVSYPNTTNYMPSPFDPSGWHGATSDPDGTITNLTLQNPSGSSNLGICTQVNESIFLICQSDTVSVEIGEKVFAAILIKQIDMPRVRFRFYDSQGFLDNVFYDIDSNEFQDGDGRSTSVGDGYYIIEVPFIASRSDTGLGFQIYPWPETGSPNSYPPAGSQLYVQAAFFGKTGKYQGAISYNAVNYMPSPFDPEGWDNDNFKTSITNLTQNNPSGESFSGLCEQVLDGGSADSITNGNTGASVAIGDKYYISVIAKSITNDNSFRLRFNDDTGFLGSVSINVDTGERFSGGGGSLNQTWLVTDLANGYKLFQTEVTAYRAGSYMDGQIILEGKNTAVAPPPIGSQLYVQAAFFGKADDWPAIITPADPDQFPAAITYEY